MENSNSFILGDRHTIIIFPTTPTPSSTIIVISSSIGIGNHQYQASAKDQPPSLDLVISCYFIIGIIVHWQFLCQPVITFSPADPSTINFPDTCPKTVSTHAAQFWSIKSSMLQNSLLIMTTFSQLFPSDN